jgi:hypothetical protein
VTAITVSVLLIATDGITGSSRWAHHPGISAAPLLLIAAAIAAGSLVQPPRQRRRVMAVIAGLAFTAWGVAQLLSGSSAAGYLNDTAILLFITDAAYAVHANVRNAPSVSNPSRATPEPSRPEAKRRARWLAAAEPPGKRRVSRAVRSGDGVR